MNGKVRAVGGIDQAGVLSAMITWVGDARRADLYPKGDPRAEYGDIDVHLGGLDSDTDQHLDWFRKRLRPGDKVTFRVLKPGKIDAPREERPVEERSGG